MKAPHTVEPPPPYFADHFLSGGWRKIERLYGARTPVNSRWKTMLESQGHDLSINARREYRNRPKNGAVKQSQKRDIIPKTEPLIRPDLASMETPHKHEMTGNG